MKKTDLSACAIIDNGKLLLIWRKKHQHYEFPGGKVKPGETPKETAIRETREEIGCDVEIIKDFGYKDFHIKGRAFRSYKYLAKIKQGQTPKVTEPELFRDIIWLLIKDYKKYSIAPNVKDFCEDF